MLWPPFVHNKSLNSCFSNVFIIFFACVCVKIYSSLNICGSDWKSEYAHICFIQVLMGYEKPSIFSYIRTSLNKTPRDRRNQFG